MTVASTDTLASLRDKINALNYGVTASIIGTGDDTYNLVLKSNEGKENALRITATESPSGSGLSSIDNSSTNSSKQKIAGILIQNILKGKEITHSVIGVGVNVNQTKFKAYSPQATSLKLLLNKTFDISIIQEELLKCLAERIKQLRGGGAQQKEYLSALFLNNQIFKKS